MPGGGGVKYTMKAIGFILLGSLVALVGYSIGSFVLLVGGLSLAWIPATDTCLRFLRS